MLAQRLGKRSTSLSFRNHLLRIRLEALNMRNRLIVIAALFALALSLVLTLKCMLDQRCLEVIRAQQKQREAIVIAPTAV